MPTLLSLLPDPHSRVRLERALRAGETDFTTRDVVNVERWPDLHRAAAHSPAPLAILDPYASGRLELGAVESFRAHFPATTLLAYGDFGHHSTRDAVRLLRAGVADIVVRGEEDTPAVLAAILSEALARSADGKAMAELEGAVPPHLVPLVREVLRNAGRPLTPGEVARLYHRHPNTLREHLRAAGLPPVNKLIVWMRLLHAAWHLEETGASADRAARVLRFPSGVAFRNQLRRYAGVTPGELRERGGTAFLLAEFRRRLATGAWDAAPSGRPPRRGRGGGMARQSEHAVAQRNPAVALQPAH